MQQEWLSLSFVFALFISFPSPPFHLESTLLGMKDLLFVLLRFTTHASLRDRSPESSEPYVTLDSRSSLSRPTSGVHTTFFPSSHLRVSRTHRVVGLLKEFWLTDTPSLDETSCVSFHLKKKKIRCRDVFRSFHWNEFVYQVVILHRILSFSCNTNTNDFFFRHFGSC